MPEQDAYIEYIFKTRDYRRFYPRKVCMAEFEILFMLPVLAQFIYHAGHITGTKAVVDIYDADTTGTTVQHG